MPQPKHIDIKDLALDLKNPRTVPQDSEAKAIETMISIKPDRFNAVMESILDDGYLMTENIIVLNDGQSNIVKEGNRRIAILKIIHGFYDKKNFAIPSNLQSKIDSLTPEWLASNRSIPCGVYSAEEAELVEKTVNLTHAKGEKASRDPWTSVAKARHNRDIKGGTELGLDLLENYLRDGKNINQSQKERWSGDYPLTVLDEAIRKIYVRLNFNSVNDLVSAYPKMEHRLALEQMLLDIGSLQLGFNQIRDKHADFLLSYGITPKEDSNQGDEDTTGRGNTSGGKDGRQTGETPSQQGAAESGSGTSKVENSSTATAQDGNSHSGNSGATTSTTSQSTRLGTSAYVKNTLKKFTPKGDRPKVAAIKDEMCKLNINQTPMAFCFLLRSAFEISAKEFCNENNISLIKKGNQNKTLAELLNDVANHLTEGNKNLGMQKVLHGAQTEITKPEGILSVTSMNQLVHNPTFSIAPNDICTIFGNIYPLLEAMN